MKEGEETATNFGISQVIKKTPIWANIMFQSVMNITFVAAFIIASDPVIPDSSKVRLGIYLKALDILVMYFSRLFGVDVKEPKDNVKSGR